jgi:acyl carrier protein
MNDPVDEKITQAMARTFRVPDAEITMSKKRGDLPGWDSLGHLTVIMEIERELGIRFPMDQINELQTVAAVCDLARKIKAGG